AAAPFDSFLFQRHSASHRTYGAPKVVELNHCHPPTRLLALRVLRLLRAHYSLAGPGAAPSTKKFPPASCSPLVSERRNRSCSIRHSGRGLFVALHYGHRASGRGLDWVIRVDWFRPRVRLSPETGYLGRTCIRGLRTCPWARLVIRVSGVRLHSPVGGARGDQQEAGTSAQRHGRGRQTAA